MILGDVSVRLPLEAGQVSLKQKLPDALARLQELVKQDLVVTDALASEEDVERMRAGLQFRGYLHAYARIPTLDAVKIDDRDWATGRRIMAKAIAGLNLNEDAPEIEAKLTARANEDADLDARIELGEIGRPVVFGNDPQAVKFSLALPIATTIAGESDHRVLGAECAIIRIRQKLVVLYLYRERVDGQDAMELRAELERTIERLRAANA